MFGLQAVIIVPIGTIREAKSAIDEINLNIDLWGLETEVLEQLYQIIVDRYFS
jgi:hypothetical protein